MPHWPHRSKTNVPDVADKLICIYEGDPTCCGKEVGHCIDCVDDPFSDRVSYADSYELLRRFDQHRLRIIWRLLDSELPQEGHFERTAVYLPLALNGVAIAACKVATIALRTDMDGVLGADVRYVHVPTMPERLISA